MGELERRGGKGKGLRPPRLLIVWLAVACAALVAASTLSASSTIPDGYVPTPTCVATPTPVGGAPYNRRIDAGGLAYTDTLGNLWDGDAPYAPCSSPFGWTTGETSTVPNNIANTPDPALYRSQRFGDNFGYRFLAPNGNYEITLGFAETYFGAANVRRFNVLINGVTRVTDLDVFAAAGGAFIAYTRMLTATVSNGLLAIDFVRSSDTAMVSTLYVHQVLPPTPTPTNSRTATATATATATNTATPTATDTPPPLDPNEPNDTYAQALLATPGRSYPGYIQSPDDVDYFALDAPNAQTYIIARLSGLPADYDLILDDAQGNRLFASTQRGIGDEMLAFKVQQAGRYYVRVVGFDHAWSTSGAYDLRIDLSPPAAAPASGDAYEPNDTPAQASLLAGSGFYTATLHSGTDRDYYVLHVPAPGMYLTVRLVSLPGNYDLYIFDTGDATAFPVARSAQPGLADEAITLRPAAGRYWLLVQGFDRAWSISPYTMAVTLTTATPTATATATPSNTATVTRTRTATASLTASATPSATVTARLPSPTATATPTATAVATATPYRLFLPIIISEFVL